MPAQSFSAARFQYPPESINTADPPGSKLTVNTGAMAQVTLVQGAQFDTSLALRVKVLSLYSLDTNTDAVGRTNTGYLTDFLYIGHASRHYCCSLVYDKF